MSTTPATINPMKSSDIPDTSRIRNYRFLTLQGGGMKGIGYVGALEELEATGVLSQIEGVAGSSAGAIVAALVAVGYTAKEVREVMINLDFRDLQDKDSPGWLESTGLKEMLGGGLNLTAEQDRYQVLNKIPLIKKLAALPGRVVGGLETAEEIGSLAMSSELGLWKGETLLNIVSAMIARKTGKPNLTFRELAALAKENPGVFRALTLTGSNLTTKALEYYNAEDWPDMPIVNAVRISASFPGGFIPFSKPIVKRIHENGRIETSSGVRVDGGLLENLPDVFNKLPYFAPSPEHLANPEVLALSFKEKPKKETKINSGFDLVRELYKTKLSEEALRQKYAGNILYVDPKGVDTLDFDADKSRILALADSGREAAQSCFLQILNQEKMENLNFKTLSLRELIRKEIAFKKIIGKHEKGSSFAPEKQPIFNNLIVIQQWIEKKRGNHTTEELDQIRRLEERRFRRMNSDQSGLTSANDLVDACQLKINELDFIEQEYELRLKQLNLVRIGFELRISELGVRFLENKTEADSFKSQLEDLNAIQNNILNLRREITSLEIRRIPLSEPSPQLKKLEATYKKCVNKKETLFMNIIEGYRKKNDTLMIHYFEELRDNAKSPEDIFFKIPTDQASVEQLLKDEAEKCDAFMKECIEKSEKIKSEKQLFQARLEHFKNREASSKEYASLVDLHTELNKSIRQNTSTLGKLLNYCVSEQPSLKKNVVTFLVQALSFIAFVARLGVSIASVFPAITYLAAGLTKRFSSNPKASATADRILRAFHMPNLFKLNKMREMAAMSAHLLEIINKNYHANVDKTEQTYLFRQFSLYLKKSGLKLEDILPKRNDETKTEYSKRVKLLGDKLTVSNPQEHVIRDLPKSFKENVNLLKTTVMLELGLTSAPKAQAEKQRMARRRNTHLIHLKYLADMNQKIKEKQELTISQTLEYINSAAALKAKIPDTIQKQFLEHLDKRLRHRDKRLNPNFKSRLTQEEFVTYLALEPSLSTQKIADTRQILLKDKEYRQWLESYELPKPKEEIEQAWNTFFDFTRRQGKGNSSKDEPKPPQAPSSSPGLKH